MSCKTNTIALANPLFWDTLYIVYFKQYIKNLFKGVWHYKPPQILSPRFIR